MEEKKIRHVNRSSDFRVVFSFPNNKLPEYPWCIELKTLQTPAFNIYTASFDGAAYHRCAPLDDGNVLVLVDNHNLAPGLLCYELKIDIPDSLFGDGEMNLTTPGCTGIEVWDGPSEDLPIEQLNAIIATLKGDPGPGVVPGGSTGQVLAKRSDEDYDTQWLGPLPGRVVASSTPQRGAAEVFNGAIDDKVGVKPGALSHAEGDNSFSRGDFSHAEGVRTVSEGEGSHAEGGETHSIGRFSHAEGAKNVARGDASHAGGYASETVGKFSIAYGNAVCAAGDNQAVFGSNNVPNENDALQVGIGTDGARKNGFCVGKDGDIRILKNPGADEDVSLQKTLAEKTSKEQLAEVMWRRPLVVNEILHDVLPFRPKGHVCYIARDISKVQIAGIIPNRSNIKEGGIPKTFTEKDRDFTTPVFNKRYVESLRYELHTTVGGDGEVRRELEGEIVIKLQPLHLANFSLSINNSLRGRPVEFRVGDHVYLDNEVIPPAILEAAGWEVRFAPNEAGSMHIKIFAVGIKGVSARQYMRVNDNHEYEVIGWGKAVSIPYVGRINSRSPRGTFPGESIYAQIVSPHCFRAGTIVPEFPGDRKKLVEKLGYADAWEEGYRLFVRLYSTRGFRYTLYDGIEIYSRDIMKKWKRHIPVSRVTRKPPYENGFRISSIHLCLAKPRKHKDGVSGPYYSMDMSYPRFYFKLKPVIYSYFYNGRFIKDKAWKALL